MAPPVEIRRVYDHDPGGGDHRVLVDRLWPRGISKNDAALDEWAKDVSPSTTLRRWYAHEPARFEEFVRRYREELSRPPGCDALARLRDLALERRVTLVTATRDLDHSGAVVLLEILREETGGRTSTQVS